MCSEWFFGNQKSRFDTESDSNGVRNQLYSGANVKPIFKYTILTALILGKTTLAAAQVCAPGTVASPASFSGTIRPALAEDINPTANIVEINLTAREAQWDFGIPDTPASSVFTYNGVIPGPMIEANIGDTLIVNFCNDLNEPTTVHWHGLETPANMDGSHIAQLTVGPGESFRYEFPLLIAGTFWYHPHVRTNVQVEQGLYGALVVHDETTDTSLSIPSLEHVFLLDDVLIDLETGVIEESFSGTKEEVAKQQLDGREGNRQLLNGKFRPNIDMERYVPHRIRMINTANARFMRMSVPFHPFYRIGGDQGLIEDMITKPPAFSPLPGVSLPGESRIKVDPGHVSDPNPETGTILTPGERADVIFVPEGNSGDEMRFEWHDMARGRHTVTFDPECCGVTVSHPPDGDALQKLYATIVLFGDLNETDYEPPTSLVDLQPISTTLAPTLPLVMGHTIPDWEDGTVKMFLQAMMKPFGVLTPEDVYTVEPNKTYIWEVRNLTGGHHNFHTHGFAFQHIETRFVDLDAPDDPFLNRTEPATHLENKDTFLIPSRPSGVRMRSWSISRFAVKFRDDGRVGQIEAGGKIPTATTSGGWLMHCHLLDHSALGMMSFFQVYAPLFSDGFEDSE